MPHEFNTDTLDDIKQRDILNLEVVLKKKNRKNKHFKTSEEANLFTGTMLQQILSRLGVPLEIRDPDLINERMLSGNIRVEPRAYNEPDDEWRSGFYVYKDDEIAGFIGYPIYDENNFGAGYRVLCTEKI